MVKAETLVRVTVSWLFNILHAWKIFCTKLQYMNIFIKSFCFYQFSPYIPLWPRYVRLAHYRKKKVQFSVLKHPVYRYTFHHKKSLHCKRHERYDNVEKTLRRVPEISVQMDKRYFLPLKREKVWTIEFL